MRSVLSLFINIFCAMLLIAAAYFLTMSDEESRQEVKIQTELGPRAVHLQKHLLQYGAPERIQMNNYTNRLQVEADTLKKIKLPLKKESQFYISIDLFTDENDPTAPLVAQIQFFDRKTQNKIKEEVINLNETEAH